MIFSLHNPFWIFLYIWTINVYIQQTDGNKCVWAFNFLFVSEGRLTEVKLLPSTDPKLICFFCCFSHCFAPSFCLSQVYYLNGLVKKDYIWIRIWRKTASSCCHCSVSSKQRTSMLLNNDSNYRNRWPPFCSFFLCARCATTPRSWMQALVDGLLFCRTNDYTWHADLCYFIGSWWILTCT